MSALVAISMSLYLIVAAVAYLLGSIPFGYILVRLFRGEDVRSVGSGNIGATNVARKSPALGIATLVLDAVKGALAVLLSLFAMAQSGLIHTYDHGTGGWIVAVGSVAVILGHMFPVWLRFRGGKGVATALGVFLALAPKAAGLVLVVFALVVLSSRYVSLGSIAAALSLPFIVWALYRDYGSLGTPLMFSICVAAALIIYKHKDNIRRLLAGTESRLELKRGAKA